MVKRTCLLASLLSILLVAGASAQEIDFNLIGAGARADGMSGAFIGVADDATAVVWNPAGLASLERSEGSIVTRFVNRTWELQDSEASFEGDDSHKVMNFASLAIPFASGGNNFVFALAYQRQVDLYGDFDDSDTTHRGGADTITPGIGFRVSPWLMFGAAANFWMGKWDSESIGEDFILTDNTDWSGTNFVLGALIDFEGRGDAPPLKVGVSMRTPFTLEDKRDITLSDPDGVEMDTADALYEWEMPTMIGIGGSLRIGDNLTVAADYEARMFGDSMVKTTFNYSDGTSEEGEFQLSSSGEDLNQIRVGAELLLIADFGVIPLRAGWKSNPTLLADYRADEKALDGAQVVGSGLIFERISIDIAYSSTRSEQDLGGDMTWIDTTKRISLSGILYF